MYNAYNQKVGEYYVINGFAGRENAPATIVYNLDGTIKATHFKFDNKYFNLLEELQKYIKHQILE